MKPHEAYERHLLQRRLQYLELSDAMREWINPSEFIPPAMLEAHFADINTKAKLIAHLAELDENLND